MISKPVTVAGRPSRRDQLDGRCPDTGTAAAEKYWEILRNTEKYWEILSNTEKYWEILRNTEKYWEILIILASARSNQLNGV